MPEAERRRRHALRARLTWLGFGTVSAGVWIAPGHLAAETEEVLDRAGLSGYVTLFRAEYLAFGDLRSRSGGGGTPRGCRICTRRSLRRPGRCWPAGRVTAAADGEAFADYVRALTAWRRLPFLDPGLPADLLPDGWNGLRADAAFAALRGRLAGPARAHVLAVSR